MLNTFLKGPRKVLLIVFAIVGCVGSFIARYQAQIDLFHSQSALVILKAEVSDLNKQINGIKNDIEASVAEDKANLENYRNLMSEEGDRKSEYAEKFKETSIGIYKDRMLLREEYRIDELERKLHIKKQLLEVKQKEANYIARTGRWWQIFNVFLLIGVLCGMVLFIVKFRNRRPNSFLQVL